jgi:hypothetical protein
MYKVLDKLRLLTEPERDWITKVICIWGGSKSDRYKIPLNQGAVPLTIDNYKIEGYNGEDIVVFNDFDSKLCDVEFIYNLCNKCPMIINDGRNWKPKVIYFTSNTNPEFWWSDSNLYDVWLKSISRIIRLPNQ